MSDLNLDDMDDMDDIDLEDEAGEADVYEETGSGNARINAPQAAVTSLAELRRQGGAVQNRAPAKEPDEVSNERLVAKFGDAGQVAVARFDGSKQLEAWRAPSKSEVEALRTRGQLVKGGLAPAGAMGAVEPGASSTGWSVFGKTLPSWAPFALAGAAAYGAWWYAKKNGKGGKRKRREAEA